MVATVPNIVISNEVLEHVNEPTLAMAEMARVLRPGGELFLTIPFDARLERNIRRAEVVAGEVRHYLEPAFHGNPLSDEGSLVFTDFGWEAIRQLEDVGFNDVAMHVYGGYEYGHLGIGQFYFHALRKGA